MPLALARVQQAVLHELLWRWPTDGSGAATDEGLGEGQDSLGTYVTAHALAEHEDGLLAQRRIRSYREYWKDERGQKSALFTTPEHAMLQVRVGSGAWFEALDGRTVIDGNGLHSDNRVSALSQEPTEGALDDASRDPGDYRFENLLPRHYPVRAPRAVSRLDHQARALVRDLTVEQSIAGYLQRVDDSAGYNDQWMPLMHYLEARPEATDDIVKSLKNGDIPEDAAPGVYVALGRTRTDEAKQALWDIMADDTAPEPERMRAMFNLIDRDDVDATLAQTLSDYTPLITSGSNPIERIHGREALLALGAMAGLHEDPEVHALAKGAIEAVLASSNEAMVVRPAFGAMANMADPAMLGTAERHALSTDEAMREAAAVVVRRLAPQDATDYVAERLADEASPKVRRALYRTMENQLADTPVAYGRAVVLEAVADLADQPGPMTRRAIINVLGHAASEHDEARIALMKQIPIELGKRSGLYDVIVSHLEPPDIQEALAYAE